MNYKILIMLALLPSVFAGVPQVCSNGAELAVMSPDGMMVTCDDPQDATCEQDFETLCPADWNLCTVDEFNAHNDGMDYGVAVHSLGEIQCRVGGGAGHFSVKTNEGDWDVDRANNMWAGSSIPGVCESTYGCNEQQYHALCCYGEPVDDGRNDVPEFSVIGASLVLVLAGLFIYHKRN